MDPDTLEAIKHCSEPWWLSDEAFDFWEEYQLSLALDRAGY